MSDDLTSLFTEGSGLDDDAVNAMVVAANNFGPAIQAALGQVGIDDVGKNEVLLVTLLIDDSGSIAFARNEQAVRDGHNAVIAALKDAKSATAILVSCGYLNGTVLYPYVPLDQAVLMNAGNYIAAGGTPLYDMAAITLTAVVAKMRQLEQGGITVRGVTYVITDGADTLSTAYRTHAGYGQSADPAPALRHMVEGMLRTESHIIGAVGIEDTSFPTDFRDIFRKMGIPDSHILTTGSTPSEIRHAFGQVSQSAVRVSAAANFSRQLGGFTGN